MKHITPIIATAIVAATAAADITPINAGDLVALSGITHAQDNTLQAVVLDDWSQGFSIANDIGEEYSGSIQSRVSQRTDTGELDFYWRIRDTSTHSNFSLFGEVASIVVTGFAGWDVGVEWRVDGLGETGASNAFRSKDADSIGYLFANPTLNPLDDSKAHLARTGAFDYDGSGTITINLISGESVTLSTFAPTVPSPAPLALGACSMLLASRRRR